MPAESHRFDRVVRMAGAPEPAASMLMAAALAAVGLQRRRVPCAARRRAALNGGAL
jgi:hypothetical protein